MLLAWGNTQNKALAHEINKKTYFAMLKNMKYES